MGAVVGDSDDSFAIDILRGKVYNGAAYEAMNIFKKRVKKFSRTTTDKEIEEEYDDEEDEDEEEEEIQIERGDKEKEKKKEKEKRERKRSVVVHVSSVTGQQELMFKIRNGSRLGKMLRVYMKHQHLKEGETEFFVIKRNEGEGGEEKEKEKEEVGGSGEERGRERENKNINNKIYEEDVG